MSTEADAEAGVVAGKGITAADRAVIERWIALDPDPRTSEALTVELRHDPVRAAARFRGRIGFGTAGLRAAMGPGPMAMNRLVVRQTTLGLVRWLGDRSGDRAPHVVVGYDARHHSAEFAHDVAAVVAGAGGRAELLPGPTPTPVLAFAVLDRSADAGVMITASHNPPADNGYKLYLDDGIQLVGPADVEIAGEIDRVAAEMADLERSVTSARAVIDVAPDAVHPPRPPVRGALPRRSDRGVRDKRARGAGAVHGHARRRRPDSPRCVHRRRLSAARRGR